MCGGLEVLFGLTTAQPLSNPRLEDRDSSDSCSYNRSESKKHAKGNGAPELDNGNHANSFADPKLYALGRFARRRLLRRVVFLNHVKFFEKPGASD